MNVFFEDELKLNSCSWHKQWMKQWNRKYLRREDASMLWKN